MTNFTGPLCIFRLLGKFSGQDQVGDLKIRAVLRQLFNVVTTVAKNATVSINKGDATLAGRGVEERRVIASSAQYHLRTP